MTALLVSVAWELDDDLSKLAFLQECPVRRMTLLF